MGSFKNIFNKIPGAILLGIAVANKVVPDAELFKQALQK